MKSFKSLTLKEKMEYIGILAIYPLILLYEQIGKSVKFLNSRSKQITASILTVCLMLTMIPVMSLTAFATTADWSYPTSTPAEPFADGTGEESDPYIIATAQQLANMSYLVNNDNANYGEKHYKLSANIDLAGGDWTPVGDYYNTFMGTFDGAYYTISNLTVQGDFGYCGLFGYVSGMINNVAITNANVNGSYYVGGVAGYLEGAMVNNCSVSGSISGNTAGGISGYLVGTIYNCFNTATVTATAVSYSANAGGITGYLYAGDIMNSYNAGAVSSSVSGEYDYADSCAGGIVGFARNDPYVQVINCYNIGAVTAENTAIGSDVKCLAGALAGDSPGSIFNSYWLTTSAATITGDNGGKYYCDSFENSTDTVSYNGATDEVSLLEALNAYVTGYSRSAENYGETAGLRIWAEDTENTNNGYPIFEELHIHNNITFIPWFSTDIFPTTSGNYYLVNDVTATGNISIASGANITLCLNGKTLDLGNSNIKVAAGGVLNVCDCGTQGKITGSASSDYLIDNEGSLTAENVTIENTGSDYVIYNYGAILNLTDCDITAEYGVFVTRSAANILNSNVRVSANSYAIILSTSDAIVNIDGGTIVSEQAIAVNATQGSLYLAGDASIFSNNDGKAGILRNTSGSSYNGKIYAHAYGDPSNVFSGSTTLTTSSSSFSTTEKNGFVFVYEVSEQSADCFSMENSAYKLEYGTGDNANNLVVAYSHEHTWSDEWTSNETHHWHECENADCTVTEDSEKDGYAAHDYTGDYTCDCGLHTHDNITFDKEWTTKSGTIPAGNYYLTGDFTATGVLTVAGGTEVNLCLNGHTLDLGSRRILVQGTLNIYDCQGGEGAITSATDIDDEVINNSGAVTLYSGKIVNTGETLCYGIYSVGGLTEIKGGRVESKVGIKNSSTATLNVSGDAVITGSGDYGYAINNQGIVNVSGGEIVGGKFYGIYNANKVTVTGGLVRSKVMSGICNSGSSSLTAELVVSGGTVQSGYNDSSAIRMVSYCKTTISGNALIETASGGSEGIEAEGGEVYILGGTVKGDYAIRNTGAKVYISGGTLTGINYGSYGVYNGATVEITGGTITSNYGGVYNYGTGTVKITDGNITGTSYGIYNRGTGTVTISGGTVKATDSDSYGYGIYNYGTGTIKFLDGEINGANYGIYNGDGTIEVAGGTLIGTNKNGIYSEGGYIYLSGNPTISGGDDIYRYSGEIYAHANGDINDAYEGGPLTVKISSRFTDGVVVYEVNDNNAEKFSLAEGLTQTLVRVGNNLIVDGTAPTGEISIGTNHWNEFLNTITFGLFFKETQSVTITADDNFSGVKEIVYYLSAEELSIDEIKAFESNKWTVYTDAFNVEPENKYVVYARITDNAGNIIYINSDGIVLDSIKPVIAGVEDGKEVYGDATFTIEEDYLDTVTLDGEPIEIKDGKYSVPADNKEHTIIVIDKTGNAVTYKLTVYKNYKVSFVVDGKEISSSEVGYGKDATFPEIPKKDGYTAKWDVDGKNITADTVITAVYTKIPQSPQTDDNINIWSRVAVLFASGISVFGIIATKKRKEEEA